LKKNHQNCALKLSKFRLLPALFFYLLVTISPLLISIAPSIIARILIFIIFSATIVWLLFDFHEKLVINLLAFVSFSIFVFILGIAIIKPMMVLTPVITIAEQYSVGNITFPTAQSYFFLTHFITYVLNMLSGLSINHVAWIVVLHVRLVSAVTCLYIAHTSKTLSSMDRFSFSYAVPFAIVLVGITMVDYRSLGTLLFMTLLSYIFVNGDKMTQSKAHVVVAILLATGATIGSPPAAILIVLVFSTLVIINRRSHFGTLSIISLAYLIYAGISYLLGLKSYLTSVLEGLIEFFQQALRFEFPERVIPTGRTTVFMPIDTYTASTGYLALIALSILSIMLKPSITGNILKRNLLRVYQIWILILLLIDIATYVGISTIPEVIFSDIRTLVFYFLVMLLPFVLTNENLQKLIKSGSRFQRIFIVCVTILIILSSLRLVATIYPKSVEDPILVVEDPRLGWDSGISAIKFLIYSEGREEVLLDTKFSQIPPATYLMYKYHDLLRLRSIEFLPYQDHSIVLFNVNGIKYPSIYVPSEIYAKAYHMSLAGNRLYDSGDYLLASFPP